MTDPIYMNAKDAADALGISLPTLYAYVSRGLIRSESAGSSRSRRYRSEDVTQLRGRRDRPRNPEAVAGQALEFGMPVLSSGITLIDDGHCYYRGRDSSLLAEHMTLEETARLLWQAESDPFTPDNLPPPLPDLALPKHLPPTSRCLVLLPIAAAADHRAWAIEPPAALHRVGARVMRLVAAAIVDRPASAKPLHLVLAQGWKVKQRNAIDLIRAALVLIADHELNVSAFTVRCITSASTTLYGATIGGLAALQGARHGGASERAEAFLDELVPARDLRLAIGRRLQRGEHIPGFGHKLYRHGDPRATWLLRRLTELDTPDIAVVVKIAECVTEMIGHPPNIDFALAAAARGLKLPSGAPLSLFTVGRTAGWIGHALEQYAAGNLIRPRARYTGPPPATIAP